MVGLGLMMLDEVGLDHYVINLDGVTGAPGSNFDTVAKVTGGSGIQATENYIIDTGKLVLQLMELSGTSTSTTRTAKSTTGTAISTKDTAKSA